MPTVFHFDISGAHAIADIAAWSIVVPGVLAPVAIAKGAHRRKTVIEAALAGAATIGFAKAASLLYVRARRFVVHHTLPMVAHAADNGFPSDHAAAAGLAVAFLWRRSRASSIVAIGFALLIRAAASPHNCIGRSTSSPAMHSGLPDVVALAAVGALADARSSTRVRTY